MSARKGLACGLLLLALGACSSKSPSTSPSTAPEATASASTSGAAIDASSSTKFGTILVDHDGRSLYFFDKDKGSESSCNDECAATWPPVLASEGKNVGTGVDQAKLGTTKRSDGTKQLTFNDRPLYRFSGDQKAGDTNGQGIGGVWHVAGVDGEPVTAAASGSSAPPASDEPSVPSNY